MDAASATWRSVIGLQGPPKEAPRKGWDEVIARARDRLMLNPEGLPEAKCRLMNDVPHNSKHRQLASKLWLASMARDPDA